MKNYENLIARLKEEIIADAFQSEKITDGKIADRLIRERAEAAEAIEKLLQEIEDVRFDCECEIKEMDRFFDET